MRSLLLAALTLTACATYTDQTLAIRNQVIHGQLPEALEELNKSSIASRKRDEVLFRMERGMLHYLSGQYDKACKDWEKSFYKSEELYTLSLSKTAASLTVSEDFTDYEGEDHERVLVPVFSALSYFSAGNLNAALVEIRRAYNLISKLKLTEDDQAPRIDGFPFLVSGILYEANYNWDSAIIEYRKALKFYRRDVWDSSQAIRQFTAESLWRLAEYRNRREIIADLEDAGFKKPSDSLTSRLEQAEVFVLVERGQSPIKVPKDFGFQHSEGLVNISFPAYQAITRASATTQLLCNGVECERSFKATDIGILAERALEKRRIRDIAKLTARLLIKEGTRQAAKKHLGELGGLAVMIANVATERADTRSWTLLPENIQIARIKVPTNIEYKIALRSDGSFEGQEWKIKLAPGQKRLIRVRRMY